MSMETTIFIFNENGLIPAENMNAFSNELVANSKFKLNILDKSDIDSSSTIFKKALAEGLEFVIYDHGYVLKLEGEIVNVIPFLKELDEVIPNEIEYFLSPIQAIQNIEKNKYPRGASIQQLSFFLDELFNNEAYSVSLNN